MKKVLFAILALSALVTACNLGAVPQAITPVATSSETATSVYTQPLATPENFLTLIAPPSPTPFQPATATLAPVGDLTVTSRWEGEKVIVQTEFKWTNKERSSNIWFKLVCDDIVSASGPIVEGLNQAGCEPAIGFEYKIGDVTVTAGKKEGYTVTSVYTVTIP